MDSNRLFGLPRAKREAPSNSTGGTLKRPAWASLVSSRERALWWPSTEWSVEGSSLSCHSHRIAMKRSLVAVLLITAAGLLPVLLLGAHAPLIGRALGMGSQVFGTMVGAFFAVTGIASIQCGSATERRGWQWGIRVSAILLTVALLGPVLLPHLWTFAIVLIGLGSVGFALSVPASSLALTDQAPERHVATLFGIRQATVLVAAMVTGLSLNLTGAIGWRAVFAAFAIVPFVAAFVVPARPSSHPDDDPFRLKKPDVAPDNPAGRMKSSIADVRALALLTVGGGMATVAGPSLTAFLVLDLVDRGLTEGHAGSVLSLAAAVGIAVRIAAGLMIDRTSSAGFLPMVLLIGLGGLGFLGLALGSADLLVPSATLAYAAGWGWSGVFYYVLVAHFPAAPARATGLAQLGVTAGAALGPASFGWLAASAGYRAVWGATAGCLAVGLALLAVAGRRLGRPDSGGGVPAAAVDNVTPRNDCRDAGRKPCFSDHPHFRDAGL